MLLWSKESEWKGGGGGKGGNELRDDDEKGPRAMKRERRRALLLCCFSLSLDAHRLRAPMRVVRSKIKRSVAFGRWSVVWEEELMGQKTKQQQTTTHLKKGERCFEGAKKKKKK